MTDADRNPAEPVPDNEWAAILRGYHRPLSKPWETESGLLIFLQRHAERVFAEATEEQRLRWVIVKMHEFLTDQQNRRTEDAMRQPFKILIPADASQGGV